MTNNQTKAFFCQWLAGLLLGLQMAAATHAGAQNFYLNVHTSPTNAVQVGASVTYTIGLSNLSAFNVSAVIVTNTLPASLQLTGRTLTQGSVVTNGSSLIFFVGLVPSGSNAVMTVTARTTAAGYFTNQTFAFAQPLTNVLTTTVVSLATNAVVAADLAVALSGPAAGSFPGDWVSYTTGVTNLGPNTATNIFVTNTLPVGAKLLGTVPANQSYVSNRVILAVSTLASNAVANFVLRVQLPTNAGAATFTAAVGASGSTDPNPTNNTASSSVTLSDYSPITLLAITNAPQSTNRQNGFIEQPILVSNLGTAAVDSVRVTISGLTNVSLVGHTNYLFNAWGTNAGQAYVVYPATLNPNASVELRLQFYVRTRSTFPFTRAQLHATGVTLPDLTPPPSVTTSVSNNFTRSFPVPATGEFFLEFQSTPGKTYTIVYSDDLSFANARMIVPSVLAFANYVQWFDYGPPATVSKPGGGARYYKVFTNP